MFGLEVVLAAVAVHPALHHLPVECDAEDRPPFGAPAFDLRDEFADQPERVGPTGEFAQVVDFLHHRQRRVGIESRQRVLQVVAHLFLAERQEEQRAVVAGRRGVAILSGEVVVLRLQAAEVVRATRDQQFRAGVPRRAGSRLQAQQLACEVLSVDFA